MYCSIAPIVETHLSTIGDTYVQQNHKHISALGNLEMVSYEKHHKREHTFLSLIMMNM